ncbi:MAG: NUDIX domain-containing protein [Dehalococcoidia bacterium]
MNSHLVIACDPSGQPTGELVDRAAAHRGTGRTHLAIVVLLVDGAGRVLLQRRKHALFDGLWDWTGATHPVPRADGGHEPLDEAARRCLGYEYEVGGTIEDIQLAGGFLYFAEDGDNCENEFCYLIRARLVGSIAPKDAFSYEVRWLSVDALSAAMHAAPETFTPWALAGASLLEHEVEG